MEVVDLEIWKDIPGYEGLYRISNMGRIFSIRNGKIRKDVRSGHGYRAIQLSDSSHRKHRFYVHRLVAITFLGIPEDASYEVNHINLIKTDNRIANLEWVSRKDNYKHGYINGRTDFRRPIRTDNTTGVKGVSRKGNYYQVDLCGKYIGLYEDLATAAFARWDAERSLYEILKL
jgi:hypothetical protein